MFCSRCGSELSDDAKFCKKCGTAIKRQVYDNPQVVKEESNEFSNKDKMTTGLLCLLLGVVGGHRFYTGNKKTGII